MNPLPPALAALQRYDMYCMSPKDEVNPIDRQYSDGTWCRFADVLSAWPTQAQGEAVVWVSEGTLKMLDEGAPGAFDTQLANIKTSAKTVPLYTHPSPSTAALREALRDLVEANDLGAHLLPEHPTIVRARQLLEGDKT